MGGNNTNALCKELWGLETTHNNWHILRVGTQRLTTVFIIMPLVLLVYELVIYPCFLLQLCLLSYSKQHWLNQATKENRWFLLLLSLKSSKYVANGVHLKCKCPFMRSGAWITLSRRVVITVLWFFFLKDILFFLFFIIYLFIFMAVLGLRFWARAFSSCGKWGLLLIAVRGPLTIGASLVAEHRLQTRRLSNCGSWAELLRGMWELPRPGLELVSPALAGRFSTTAPPGKPPANSCWWEREEPPM